MMVIKRMLVFHLQNILNKEGGIFISQQIHHMYIISKLFIFRRLSQWFRFWLMAIEKQIFLLHSWTTQLLNGNTNVRSSSLVNIVKLIFYQLCKWECHSSWTLSLFIFTLIHQVKGFLTYRTLQVVLTTV